YKDVVRIGGGVVILILGVHVSGLTRLKFLDFEKRIDINRKPMHIFGTFLVGMAFGAGWSPCIGPLLGSILIIAGSQETVSQGVLLLVTYSAGLAIPFLLISVWINSILSFLKRASGALKYVNAVAGIMLVTAGVLLITNKLDILL
ncbi:MAG: cytochrome c biogenesis protein CcdA, partial [Thermodesulfobacteriota bacterium]|nr:cytochrome c biogenesis protein CcdA [Thermodesulfobacteriota bacterium]